jgi:hypothetical protein
MARPATDKKFFNLWTILLALAGLVIPSLLSLQFSQNHSWAQSAAEAHSLSLQQGAWASPWIAIPSDRGSPAWIACSSLEDAILLDQVIDDGALFTGKLRLAEGGLAWIP